MAFALLSHGLNVLVLIAVLWGLWGDTPGMAAAYGPDAPARRILASVYVAIALASLAALVFATLAFSAAMALRGGLEGRAALAFAAFSLTLFALQVLYKVTSAVLAGPDNPVVVANLAIAAFHAVTCGVLTVQLYRSLP